MTNSRTDPTAPNPARPSPPKTRLRALWDRASLPIQLALSLAVAGGALAYLLYGGKNVPGPEEGKRAACAGKRRSGRRPEIDPHPAGHGAWTRNFRSRRRRPLG